MSMPKATNQSELDELDRIMDEYAKSNPMVQSNNINPNKLDTVNVQYTIVESGRTLTYSEKPWSENGKLVGNIS